MTLTSEQKRAVTASRSAAVTAGAGTGKTHMLTERYVHHLDVDGLRPLQIVAATFTERAAAELRGRIRSRLRGVPSLAGMVPELEAAAIGTLHALAARICREHPEAAGVPYDFSVLDDIESKLWQYGHLSDALAGLSPHITEHISFETLRAALKELLADPFTAGAALAVDPATWPALLERERREAYEHLRSQPEWQEALAVLRANSGRSGDKLEIRRLEALAAVEAFDRGDFDVGACSVLDGLTKRGGSKGAWDEGALGEVREACGRLRDLYRQWSTVFELRLGPPDEKLRTLLPALRQAFEQVRAYLAEAKRKERVLDFSDLELHALQALEHSDVREFYRKRWRAFLIDEFQDTNPVQAELLGRLIDLGDDAVSLTVVGDEKQSIYGFRRADVSVFRRIRDEIAEHGGEVVELAQSFRSHAALVSTLNGVVRPALGSMHQPLTGVRDEAPGGGPFVEAMLLAEAPAIKGLRSRAEAHLVGERIAELLAAGTPVYDKELGETRPLRPGDIAVLARTWNALEEFAEELSARAIPIVQAGGGSLLDGREAKDARALLEFLADTGDDLALATLLRSPFFAIEDRALLELAAAARRLDSTWWEALRRTEPGVPGDNPVDRGEVSDAERPPGRPTANTDMSYARTVLDQLLSVRETAAASLLLSMADGLTGYSAVVANLPGGRRRLADWHGFREFVRDLETPRADVFTVVRELTMLARIGDATVVRPGLEAGDAVALMSIHNAKGLEWPVVILPDLTAAPVTRSGAVLFDAELGVGVKVLDEAGEELEPALFTLLKRRRKASEAAEDVRVLYVALTRARDRIILSGNEEGGGRLETLRQGLEDAGVELRLTAYEERLAVPKTPRIEGHRGGIRSLLEPAGPGIVELPISSLSSYRKCPRRFRFEFVEQHPGAGDTTRRASRIGTLTHLALERNIRDVDRLAGFDPKLPRSDVEQALRLAGEFDRVPEYASLRERIERREERVALSLEGLLLVGVADAVGDGFVLDYKTGEPPEGDEHLLQVAAYAMALRANDGYLAYLASGRLRHLTRDRLAEATNSLREVVAAIRRGDLAATPSPSRCGRCPYANICSDRANPEPNGNRQHSEASLTGS